MKKIWKRTIALALGTATLCLGAMIFAGCDGGYEDDSTIKGMFSEEGFTSEEDAVKAFQSELGGEIFKVTVLKYSRESNIPKSRIKQLNTERLGEEEEVTSGKRVLVTCAQKSNVSESKETEEKSFHAEIYEVKLGDATHYRYYVNKSDYEGMIPKSYFDYLNDLKGMENFTFKSTTTTVVKAAGQEQTVTLKRSAEVEEDKFSLHISQSMINLWMYAERTGDQTKVWASSNGEDYEGGEDISDVLGSVGIDSEETEDLGYISSEAGFKLDHTYFRPALDGGFMLREESDGNFMAALSDQIKELLGTSSGKVDIDGGVLFDFSVNEYGVSHLVCEVKANVKLMGVAMQETVKIDSEFSEVGTTKVERPAGIKD